VKVLYITSWGVACGIATYSANLIEQLEKLGIQVEIFSETTNFTSLVKLAKDTTADIVHIQHEFGMALPTEAMLSLMGKFRSRGIPVVITPHTEDGVFNVLLDGVADAVILHNDSKSMTTKNTFSKFCKIPHGIPEVSFEHDKAYYRRKYDIPENAFVIGTCGFMSPQRGTFIEELVANLVGFMKGHSDVFIHLATSSHRSDSDRRFASTLRASIAGIAQEHGFGDHLYIHSEFMDTDEFRERLYTMDLGFAYSSPKMVSNSGAAADLVSCKVPVITNDAPHFSHIKPYITTCDDIAGIAREIECFYNCKDSEGFKELSNKTQLAIQDLGYSKVASRHINVYKEVLERVTNKRQLTITKPKQGNKLNKDNYITITCPNSLWQAILLWQKLQNLAKDGYRFRFVFQNDGNLETSLLPFMFDNIVDVQYADIGMTNDKRIARIHSRSLAQNMTTDLERWLSDGNSYAGAFSFLGERGEATIGNLGEFAHKRAKEFTSNKDHICLVHVSDEYVVDKAVSAVKNASTDKTTVLISASPGTEVLAHTLLKRLEDELISNIKLVIEDVRTRIALIECSNIVITGWDSVGLATVLKKKPVFFLLKEIWQHELVSELGVV